MVHAFGLAELLRRFFDTVALRPQFEDCAVAILVAALAVAVVLAWAVAQWAV